MNETKDVTEEAKVAKKMGRPPKIRPTRPWDKKDQHSRPWRTDMFQLSKKRKGFVPRFANPRNVQRLQSLGYEIADPKHYNMTDGTPEGSDPGTQIVRRGMVLMEIEEQGYKYWKDLRADKMKAKKRDQKDLVKRQIMRIAKENGIEAQIIDESKNLG